MSRYVEDADRRADSEISEVANTNGSTKRNAAGYSDSDRNAGGTEILSGYTLGEELRNDVSGSISSGVGYNSSVSDSVEDNSLPAAHQNPD